MMKFLITGLPRIRSAWLSALLTTDKVQVFHDVISQFGHQDCLQKLGYDYAVSDPTACLFYSSLAYRLSKNVPVVIVDRDRDDSRRSFTLRYGTQFDDSTWGDMVCQYETFKDKCLRRGDTLVVAFTELKESLTCMEVARHCGVSIPLHRIETFQMLNVQQHLGKREESQ